MNENEIGAIILGLAALGGVALLTLVLPILSFARATRARRIAEQASDRLASMSRVVSELLRDVEHLRATVAELRGAVPAAPADVVAADAAPSDAEPTGAVAAAPAWADAAASEAPPVPATAGEMPVPVPAEPATDAPGLHERSGDAGSEAGVPEPPPAPAVPRAAPPWTPPPHHVHPRSIEQRIGQRWLLYVGVAAVVLGASYFVKYAFDNEWVTPTMRVVLGLAGGCALVVAGNRIARRDVALFGQGLVGGGLGILYLSLYAALHFYDVLSPLAASLGMLATTGLGTWMATRHASQALAVIAAAGAYATPYLIATETRSPVPLLSYLTVLAGGTWWLVRSHEWPALAIVSFVATLTTVAGWLFVSFRAAQYLVVEAYLVVLAAVFLRIAFDLHRRATVTAARATSSGALCALGAFLLGVIGPSASTWRRWRSWPRTRWRC